MWKHLYGTTINLQKIQRGVNSLCGVLCNMEILMSEHRENVIDRWVHLNFTVKEM